MMLQEFVTLFRCPVCQSPARATSAGAASCGVSCQQGHRWPVEDGVLIFTREEPPSDNWKRSQKDYPFYLESTPQWVQGCSSVVAPIIEPIKRRGSTIHLDVCTGQGGLLYNLIQQVEPARGILSVDMSLHVQRLNSRYQREVYPESKVSFIAADAAHLPIADSSIETVSSFAMGNMLDKMRAGMKEVARVLSRGGLFAFNHKSVAEESQGWQACDREMRQMGATDYRFLALRADFEEMMDSSGFAGYQIVVTGETVGEADRDWESGPTFPFPNEPMTEFMVTAWN